MDAMWMVVAAFICSKRDSRFRHLCMIMIIVILMMAIIIKFLNIFKI